MDQAVILKVDLLKLMKSGNNTCLFNALQNRFYKIFIDVRNSQEYQKEHIKDTLNVPLERFKTSNTYPTQQELEKLIKDHKHKHGKYLLLSMYLFTDNIENKIFWNCVSFIRQTIIDLQICRASKLFVITDDYKIFAKRFPFLVTNNAKQQDEKLKKELYSKSNNNFLSNGYPNIIIDNKLFLGDFYHATSKKIFVNLGITHVVNCSQPQSIPCMFENDIDLKVKYIRVPVDDSCVEDIKKYFDKATQFIHHALMNKFINNNDNNNIMDESELKEEKEQVQNKKMNKVLIHCQAGISRSSTITIAYLMKYKNMTYEDGLKYVQERRPMVHPNATFVEQLLEYETIIYPEKKSITCYWNMKQ